MDIEILINMVTQALSADAFWSVNKALARQIGIEEATFLSEIIYKHKYWKEKNGLDSEGGFFMKSEDIQSVMGIGIKPAARLTKAIQKSGVVKVKKRGVPAKNYWYPQWAVIYSILTSAHQTGLTGNADSGMTGDAQTGFAITKKEYKESNSEYITPPTFKNTKTSKKVPSDKDKAKLDEIKKIGEPVFELLAELGFEKMNKSKEMCELVARAVKECGVDFVLRGVRGRAKSHEGKDPYWRYFFKDTVQISTAAASVKQSSGGGFNKVWQESA